MSGTASGGAKSAQKNKERYGEGFYKRIGSAGGKASGTGGFWHLKYVRGNFEAIAAAGKKGGTISRRGKRVLVAAPTPVKHWYDFLRRKHD